MEAAAPELETNWRWQMHLMRAYYDAYTRHRLIHETRLESDALDALAAAPALGAASAMDRAAAILGRATSDNCCLAWRKRIEALCDALFGSIRMQTSMAKHSASGYERGAVLDFVDHPLNNRWWLEDQFTAVRALPDEAARLARLRTLATWTRPGPGSFYDDVGSVAASPHVLRGDSLAPETLEPGGSDTALHLGGRPEPHASVVAHQHALAQGDRLPPPGSRRHLSGAAQRDQAEGAR